MELQITDINSLQLKKIYFYSVKLKGKEFSEFKDYYNRVKANSRDHTEFLEIMYFLQKIGNEEGALKRHFKRENAADRIAGVFLIESEDERPQNDYGLRLYCYRYNDEIVILFNGDRKTVADSVQYCKNCFDHFKLAGSISTGIDNAFELQEIYIKEKFLIIPKEKVINYEKPK